MRRLLKVIAGLLFVAAVGAVMVFLLPWWFGFTGTKAQEIKSIIGLATLVVMLLFVLGEVLGFLGHAYYLIAAGAIYLAADLYFHLHYGLKLGPKFWQDGFVPLSIVGVFMAPIYRAIAMPPLVIQRDP